MLGQLIARILTGEAGIYFARLRTVMTLYVLIAIAGLGALGFLLAALFIWVSWMVGPFGAALIFAGVCLAVAIILYVVLMIAQRPDKNEASDRLKRDVASIAGVAALTNLPQLLRSARRRKRYLAVPLALAGIWGGVRLALAQRGRRR